MEYTQMNQNGTELITPQAFRPTSHGENSTNIKWPRNLKDILTCNVNDSLNQLNHKLTAKEFNILNELRKENLLCDSKLRVDDGTEFPVHRALLSASNEYFRALFTNGLNTTAQDSVHIHGVDSEMMKLLVDWIYAKDILINDENIRKLLPIADQFQELKLVQKCTDFLAINITYENVIGIRCFAAIYACHNLERTAFNFIANNFLEVVKLSEELMEISKVDLIQIIQADELNIKDETVTLYLITEWIYFNIDSRKQFAAELLCNLRLNRIPKENLLEYFNRNFFYSESTVCMQILHSHVNHGLPCGSEIALGFVRDRPRIPHEILLAVGGWSNSAPTNLIESYDHSANTWLCFKNTDKAPRAYHGCIVLEDVIYIIGGFDGTHYFNNCRKFDLRSKQWKEVAPMHWKRCYVSIAFSKGFIYAVGGFDGINRLNSAEKYKPDTNQWSLIPDMIEKRSDSSATELNGKIYVCGGFNGNDCISSAEYFDTETNVWTLIRPMLSKRSGIGIISYNDCIYAIGGYNGEIRLTICEKYNPKYNNWSSIGEMKTPRSNFGIEVLNGCIYVLGGFNGYRTISDVESYSEIEKKWVEKPRMKFDRSALSVCILKGINYTRPYSAINYYST